MSARGGLYKGPNGTLLYGNGMPMEVRKDQNMALAKRITMNEDYIRGLKDAANIAEVHAKDDANAADATTDLDQRLLYIAQQERALAIQTSILTRIEIANVPC